MTLNTNQHIEFIKNTIRTEDIKIADTANKLALELKAITLDQYLQAARILVDAYIAQ